MLGIVGGGLVGGVIPGYSGKGNNILGNVFGELAYESTRGAIIGGATGAITNLARGKNVAKGFANGLLPGAIGGALHAGAIISIFGSAYDPASYGHDLSTMEKDMSMVGNGNGIYKPVYRSGGALELIQDVFSYHRGFAGGRNLYIPNQKSPYTTFHETWHYYQMNHAGWGYVLKDALFRGNYGRPGNVEWIADQATIVYP